MTLIISIITFTSLVCVHAQQNDKGTSMIPFPRIGRSDPRFFMEGKRSGNSLSPGLIPFPRIGRSDGVKRQLIPFPRVGKRPYWRLPVEYPMEYEGDYTFPLVEVPAASSVPGVNGVNGLLPEFPGLTEETEAEKRNAGASGGPGNNNNNGGMWFGPRLGRRKRSVDTESARESGAIDTHLLLQILHNFNWAIVPLKERRTFTPRLGRSSSEEIPIEQRSDQQYTPRLGRSHELGSGDLESGGEFPHHRYSRAGKSERSHQKPKGQSEETTGVVFSPRLGRDHINPRLGRSSTDEHE